MGYDRKELLHSFAARLNTQLKNKGLSSTRSEAGVKLKELASVAGCSVQMARKYALGQALPDYDVLGKIADWLNISPGWLIFGDLTIDGISPLVFDANTINLDRGLLCYILEAVFLPHMHLNAADKNELIQFTLDLMYDVTHLRTHEANIKKIVDMTVSSLFRFNLPVQRRRHA